MSFNIPMQAREGIAIEGVEGARGLGFPAAVANLIANNYRDVVANDPFHQGLEMMATHGRQHPLDGLLGPQLERMPANFRIYDLGEMERDGEQVGMDLYLAEHPELEGHGLMAYCSQDARKELLQGELPNEATMATLAYNYDDLDDILEALGADFSELEPQAEM